MLSMKELKREEPSGLGGPLSESYLLDSRGSLVERRAVVSRERLILGHCLVLSVLIDRMSKHGIISGDLVFSLLCTSVFITRIFLSSGSKDVKDVFSTLKDSTSEVSENNATINHQVHIYSC